MCETLGVTYNLYDIASEGGIDLLDNSQRGSSLAQDVRGGIIVILD